MGIHDRDYRKDSGSQGKVDVINLNEIFCTVGKLVLVFVALILCLRFPLLWIKIPLAVAILYFGWRWIFRASKKTKIRSAADQKGRPPTVTVRSETIQTEIDQDFVQRLVAFDAAGEFGKAKTLIQQLDGHAFPEPVAEELAVLARNYFPIELEPTGDGVRFKLA